MNQTQPVSRVQDLDDSDKTRRDLMIRHLSIIAAICFFLTLPAKADAGYIACHKMEQKSDVSHCVGYDRDCNLVVHQVSWGEYRPDGDEEPAVSHRGARGWIDRWTWVYLERGGARSVLTGDDLAMIDKRCGGQQ